MNHLLIHRATAIVAVAAAATLVTSCAAATPEPAPTVTVTVTATPEASTAEGEEGIDFFELEEAQQPIDPYDAWSICVAVSERDLASDYFVPSDFSEEVVTAQADGSWQVYVGFLSTDGTVGLRTTCIVGGTNLDPDVEYLGGQDFS